MKLKRMVVGASVIGALSLSIAGLGAGAAGADPASGPALDASGQPLPADVTAGVQQRADEQSTTATEDGPILPADVGDEIARSLSNLPPPDLSGLAPQVNVPVTVGLPGIGVGLVPGLSVPIFGGLPPLTDLPPIPPIAPIAPFPPIAPIAPIAPIPPIQPLGPPRLPF